MRVRRAVPDRTPPPTPVSSASRLPPGIGGEVVEQRERGAAFDHTQRRDLAEACCDLGELAGRALDSIGNRAQRPGEVGVLQLRGLPGRRGGSSDRGSRTGRLVGARAPPAARKTPRAGHLPHRTALVAPVEDFDHTRHAIGRLDWHARIDLGMYPVASAASRSNRRISLDIVDGDRLPRGNCVPHDPTLYGESHAHHRV